jgi:hypothetical protein
MKDSINHLLEWEKEQVMFSIRIKMVQSILERPLIKQTLLMMDFHPAETCTVTNLFMLSNQMLRPQKIGLLCST